MSKLFVFGCSFSGLHDSGLLNNPDMKKYYNFRGGNFPLTWSELLANDLGVELHNKALWGLDNYSIYEKFCIELNQIKKDDIVIIGWSGVNRFRLYSEIFNELVSVNIWSTNQNFEFKDVSKQTFEEIIVNRDNHRWVLEVYNWMTTINKLSEAIGFKLHYWSFFKEFHDLYIADKLLLNGAEYITMETNGEIHNDHFGEIGHKVQCEYFKKIILNPKTKNIT